MDKKIQEKINWLMNNNEKNCKIDNIEMDDLIEEFKSKGDMLCFFESLSRKSDYSNSKSEINGLIIKINYNSYLKFTNAEYSETDKNGHFVLTQEDVDKLNSGFDPSEIMDMQDMYDKNKDTYYIDTLEDNDYTKYKLYVTNNSHESQISLLNSEKLLGELNDMISYERIEGESERSLCFSKIIDGRFEIIEDENIKIGKLLPKEIIHIENNKEDVEQIIISPTQGNNLFEIDEYGEIVGEVEEEKNVEYDDENIENIVKANEKKIQDKAKEIEEKKALINKLKWRAKIDEQNEILDQQEQELEDLDNQIYSLKQNQK